MRRGAALILCMVMTAAAVTSITVISLRTVAHVRHSQYAEWRAASFSGAEAVLARTKKAVERGEAGTVGFNGDYGAILSGHTAPPVLDAASVLPQSLAGAPEIRWYAIAGTPEDLGRDMVVILAVAEVHGVHGAVEGIYRRMAGRGGLRLLTWRERALFREED